jgi:hypothetical protein
MTLTQGRVRLNVGEGGAENSARLFRVFFSWKGWNPVAAVPPPPAEAIRLENQKIRRLRLLVDLASGVLRQNEMPLLEAVKLVAAVRTQALALFPGKDRTYDLLYAPRFARILREKYGVEYPEN